MYTMNSDEIITIVAEQSGCTKVNTEKILKAYYEVLYMSIESGLKVRVPNIGSFSNKELITRENFEFFNPVTKQKETKTIEGCNRPIFTFSKTFSDHVKDKTRGNTF